MKEYLDLGHAELVPAVDLRKSNHIVYYFPKNIVMMELSSTTKVKAVFDASSKFSNGILLNNTLLGGPTVHLSLVDVLL